MVSSGCRTKSATGLRFVYLQAAVRLAPSVHRRCAERSVRLGRCEVALDVEGVAGALIGFPMGATMALSAGMIVLFVFAAMGALVLWAGERSDSDSDLGAGLDTFPSRC